MKPFYQEDGITILQGDCREILPTLPDQSVNCCVTSPPYWGLRDYGVAGQLGLEPTPEEYVSRMVEVFREVRRVLRDDGTLWLNLGDCYAHSTSGGGGAVDIRTDGRNTKPSDKVRGRMKGADTLVEGLKPKDLVGQPWRVAFALQADGWYLRSDIIWHKPNPMPESVTDRPTKAHEYLFLLSKSERYYYDTEAIKEPAEPGRHDGIGNRRFTGEARKTTSWEERKNNGEPMRRGDPGISGHITRTATLASQPGRNKRSVWTVNTEPFPEAHFATFPTALIEPCIKAGCPPGRTVFDPFGGSGTTMQVARALGCRGTMIELNRDYCRLAAKRLRQAVLPLAETPDKISHESRPETKDLFEENSVA